jgi:hypothetical protein
MKKRSSRQKAESFFFLLLRYHIKQSITLFIITTEAYRPALPTGSQAAQRRRVSNKFFFSDISLCALPLFIEANGW